MNRHHGFGYNEGIAKAYSLLPERIVNRLVGVGFVTGISPLKIGLPDPHKQNDLSVWGYDTNFSYNDVPSTWHGKYHGLPDNQPTIFLPLENHAHPQHVLHELGHVLHIQLDWLDLGETTTQYSRVNHHEAFAEAFELWACWPEWLTGIAPRSGTLFHNLSTG